ncbi:MAG: CBS domain-containing protein, partial [Desulfotomaculales bacterium]
RLGRLGMLLEKPGLEIHIYDHHPAAEDDVRGSLEVVEPVGAATTLLVEKLQMRNIAVSPFEATVMALGIYEDTGCLTFASTAPRDVQAAAHLLARGANLAVVADFLGRPLTEEQKGLLKQLLLSAQRYLINGFKILVARAHVDDFVGGLALLTHKLAEIERLDAVFCIVLMEDRTHIVGRSGVEEINVREILATFGGGGHRAAASATVKETGVDNLAARLLDAIKKHVRPPLTAADIMTSPVKAINPETKVEEVNQIILRYGHSGLPVVEGGHLVGIVSRRDLEKALRHGLGHAPVKAYMTREVKTVDIRTPVTEVQDVMIENNIGRLPVLNDGKLVGIVSRTDILKTLHRKFQPRFSTLYLPSSNQTYYRNAAAILARYLPAGTYELIRAAGRTGDREGVEVYLVGGSVRDAMLGYSNTDLDLVTVGDGNALADALAGQFGGRSKVLEKQRRAVVILPTGQQVSITAARVEFFEYPAITSLNDNSLKHELYRRDFTVNAMAVTLNEARFGEVVDYFGGREDLQYGLIRVLHNLSFVEDPVRVLRAIRYACRYGFNIQRETLALLREAVNDNLLAALAVERIWTELKRLLGEERTPQMLARLAQLNIWPQLFPGVTYWEVEPVIAAIPGALKTLNRWGVAEPAELWLSYLIAVLHWSDAATAEAICHRYRLNKKQLEKVRTALAGWRTAVNLLTLDPPPRTSVMVRAILSLPREAYPLITAVLEEESWLVRLENVFRILNEHKPAITGKDIKNLGFLPGPVFKQVLEAVWQARVDNVVRSREEELAFAKQYLSRYKEGEKIAPSTRMG